MYRRQRLANRFCKSRALPAGSLRDGEVRAGRCHGCGVPLATCLPAPGSGGALPAPAGKARAGRQDSLLLLGNASGRRRWHSGKGNSTGRTRVVVISGRRIRVAPGSFVPGLGRVPWARRPPPSHGSRRSPQRSLNLSLLKFCQAVRF